MKLILYSKEDAELFASFYSDDTYKSFFRSWAPINSFEDIQNLPSFSNSIVRKIRTGSDLDVGFIFAHNLNFKSMTCEASILISKDYWGCGWAAHAIKKWCEYLFNDVNIRKIKAAVIAPRFKDFLIRNGWNEEGVLIQECYLEGRYINEYRLSLFKE